MSGSKWLTAARAAHTRALGAPQAFPLFGDGEHVDRALCRQISGSDADLAGAALAEARYRDWDRARMTGAVETRAHAVESWAPRLELTQDDVVGAIQTRLTLPARQRPRTALDDAAAIIRGLVDEFGDLFPEECAAAVAWLRARDAG